MYIFEPVSIILTLFEWEKIQNKLKLNSCCLKPLKMYAVQLFHPGKITVQRSHLKAPNDLTFMPMMSVCKLLTAVQQTSDTTVDPRGWLLYCGCFSVR